MTGDRRFGWLAILRLGCVQAALGAVVVLTTSTLNRVMVVELGLPALLPGVLVALHFLVQVTRPRMGHGSDVGGRRTPWIVGGMVVLALGGLGAAAATVLMASRPVLGAVFALLAFVAIGLGVSACGTSLLVLLAKRVDEARRAPAATLVWLMMIAGFAITAGTAGHWLDPYSPARLLAVSAVVSALAVAVTLLAMAGLEGRPAAMPEAAAAGRADARSSGTAPPLATPPPESPRPGFRQALGQVWADPAARRFTVFVFVSMLAYSAQDLILEPFAGSVFGMTPGETTRLSGVQHGGVLLGMLAAALAGRSGRLGSLRDWQIGGCLASALAMLGLVAAGLIGRGWPLATTVFALGVANGAFSIAAIASMMRLAGEGSAGREGIRMGLWGAAQAIAFGLGGLVGTAASDLARALITTPGTAYAAVFMGEALLFVVSAMLAAKVGVAATRRSRGRPVTLETEGAR